MDPLVSGSGADATQEMKNYGMTLAAMSQRDDARHDLLFEHGHRHDAGRFRRRDGRHDGVDARLDGRDGRKDGGREDDAERERHDGLASAMARFATSNLNHSGVPLVEVQPLINKLAASSGEIR